jgi:uncharacterized protein YigA (DUF484 family)
MSEQAEALDLIRQKILDDPDVILEDQDLMKALVAANERALGGNIVDLRGIAMERLESRLDRLEDTHRSVIAAAYNAILKMLEPVDFPKFLHSLSGDLLETLRVSRMRLILESKEHDAPSIGFEDVLSIVAPGTVDHYITAGRNVTIRPVTLRQVSPASTDVYGDNAAYINSEALLKLDLGEGRLPGLLIMGSEDPHKFRPNQGTDLLTFFCSAFERAMRRWLA